jgi:hypothetical protein
MGKQRYYRWHVRIIGDKSEQTFSNQALIFQFDIGGFRVPWTFRIVLIG